MRMTYGSLFAGIGGFDLGLERAGMECRWQVEIDPYCQRVLAKHWPGVRRYGDIRSIHGAYADPAIWKDRRVQQSKLQTNFGAVCSSPHKRYLTWKGRSEDPDPYDWLPCPSCLAPVDLICGGFPCQPFSVAEKRGGKADDRYLWPEMLRVISEVRPTWVLGENVAGIIHMELDTVLADLEAEGYETQAFVIPACGVDAPHRRDRVWIVGYSESGRERIRQRERMAGELLQEARRKQSRDLSDPSGQDVADTENPNRRRANRENNPGWRDSQTGGCCQQGRGIQHWLPEPDVCGIFDELSKRMDGGGLNANAEEGRSNKELSTLRPTHAKENLQWKTGGSCSSTQEKILQSGLHGNGVHPSGTKSIYPLHKTPQETPEITLRDLREFDESLQSSQGRELEEQRPIEFQDALQFVSYKIASSTGRSSSEERETSLLCLRQAIIQIGIVQHMSNSPEEKWESLSGEEMEWVIMASLRGPFWSEWPSIPRVATGVPDRVARLRALGNAVVPQVVTAIAEAIIKAEASCQ